jgi:hypothetical protein
MYIFRPGSLLGAKKIKWVCSCVSWSQVLGQVFWQELILTPTVLSYEISRGFEPASALPVPLSGGPVLLVPRALPWGNSRHLLPALLRCLQSCVWLSLLTLAPYHSSFLSNLRVRFSSCCSCPVTEPGASSVSTHLSTTATSLRFFLAFDFPAPYLFLFIARLCLKCTYISHSEHVQN